jgi:hypothetical protein
MLGVQGRCAITSGTPAGLIHEEHKGHEVNMLSEVSFGEEVI